MVNTIDTKASSVELAIEQALEQLGATREQVEVEVLAKGSFFVKAQVRVTLIDTKVGTKVCTKVGTTGDTKVGTTGDTLVGTTGDSIEKKIEKFVNGILLHMGLKSLATVEDKDKTLFITIEGEDSGVAIGYRGETLDAFQYLTLTYLNQEKCEFRKVIVDCENYRQKRSETLTTLAFRLAEKAVRTCHKVSLEPMNPFERRIIHSALAESDIARTISEGEEPNRYVVIIPKGVEIREDRNDNFRRNDSRGRNSDNRNHDSRSSDNRNSDSRNSDSRNHESRPERIENREPRVANNDAKELRTDVRVIREPRVANNEMSESREAKTDVFELRTERSESFRPRVANNEGRELRTDVREVRPSRYTIKENSASENIVREEKSTVEKIDTTETVAVEGTNFTTTVGQSSSGNERGERRERFGMPDRNHEDKESSFDRRGSSNNRENFDRRGSSNNRENFGRKENSNNRENSFNRRDNNSGGRNFGDRDNASRQVEVEAEDGREFRGYYTEPSTFEKPEVKKTGAPKFKSFGGPKKF